MDSTRSGILAAGNFIVDHAKVIDHFPEQDTLVEILAEHRSNGGGPYNLLRNLAALDGGYPLAACGVVGDDEYGRWILADCEAHGISTTRLHFSAAAPTSYTDVMTVRDTGRRTFFHQRGANDLLDPKHCELADSRERVFYLGYLSLLAKMDHRDAQGRSGASHALEQAARGGMITMVDLVSSRLPGYCQLVQSAATFIDVLLLNELEAGHILERTVREDDPTEMQSAAVEILRWGIRRAVVIHSRLGAVWVPASGPAVIQPALNLPKEFIAGSSGAGDAFASGIAHGLHENWTPPDSLQLATCVAAASLRHPSPSEGVGSLDECRALAKTHEIGPFACPKTASGFAP